MKSAGPPAPVRYAVRQVLDQEYQADILRQRAAARQARYHAGGNADDTIGPRHDHDDDDDEENAGPAKNPGTRGQSVKRDFFGRIINEARPISAGEDAESGAAATQKKAKSAGEGIAEKKVWVSFHEGYSNAVRKPITMRELLAGL